MISCLFPSTWKKKTTFLSLRKKGPQRKFWNWWKFTHLNIFEISVSFKTELLVISWKHFYIKKIILNTHFFPSSLEKLSTSALMISTTTLKTKTACGQKHIFVQKEIEKMCSWNKIKKSHKKMYQFSCWIYHEIWAPSWKWYHFQEIIKK